MQNQKNNKLPKENESADMDVVAMLLDEENEENVILFDEKDNPVEFTQEGLVHYKNKIFAILCPLEDDADEDEAVVFEINAKQNTIEMVEDDDLADEIIEMFNKEFLEGQE